MAETYCENSNSRREFEGQQSRVLSLQPSFSEVLDAGVGSVSNRRTRRLVRADAPDCVASGYWKTLSPADRVCMYNDV
jgi:hypothetical protein